MSAAPATLKSVLSRSPSGVTVVTLPGTSAHDPHGITVSSFASGSLEPPLVLVGLDRESETHARLERDATSFCVNVLAVDQRPLAEHFAGMCELDAPFERSRESERTGAPVFADAVAFLDCEAVEALHVGDHVVHVGRVVDAAVLDDDRDPLTYTDGDWGTVTTELPDAVEP